VSDPERCTAITDGGRRCRIKSGLSDAGLCLWHDPARADQAQRARTGGRKPKIRTADLDEVPAQPQSVEDVVEWCSWATLAVATGRIDSRTAHEIGYLARALESGLEKLDLAADISELRDQLAELKGVELKAV
jgi:hypothetical protein